MTIKKLAYSVQQGLEVSTGSAFKRAHIYELLAASFGFNSYAALGTDAVFTRREPNREQQSLQNSSVRQRCVDLGYQPDTAEMASSTLASLIAERQIGIVRISDLVDELRGRLSFEDDLLEDDYYEGADGGSKGVISSEWPEMGDELDPILLEGLEAAADRGIAEAHYALALIHAPIEDDDGQATGSAFWHEQAQQGRILSGVEKEWSDAYAAQLKKSAKYLQHLREAARLKNQHALLDLAERFGDPSFFEQECFVDDVAPGVVAEIAERQGRPEDARKWLTVAAESGDIEAMRRLIEDYDHEDLQRCWTWMHLAELLGNDLAKDDFHAINEDGSPYDDDLGGQMFLAGREGVELASISAEQDAVARQAAEAVFRRIQRSR